MLKGRESFVQIPGFIIAIKEWGTPGNTPIIALHGWLDNADSFSFLAPFLTDTHFIALDSPGCGHSSHRGLGHFPSIIDEAIYVLQVAQALGKEQFVLVGHSRGAAVAQLIAAGSPHHVSALVLIDNISFPERSPLDTWRYSVFAALINKPRKPSLYDNLDDAVKGRMLAGVINYESAKALTLRGSKEEKGKIQWTFDRREMLFTSPISFTSENTNILMGGIEAPTCIILAEDGIMDKDKREARSNLIKDHELYIVAGHHHVHMDDPKPVATIIQAFLERKGLLP